MLGIGHIIAMQGGLVGTEAVAVSWLRMLYAVLIQRVIWVPWSQGATSEFSGPQVAFILSPV